MTACSVWKYAIPEPDHDGRSWLDLPSTAEPLSVGLQGDTMVLWALIRDDDTSPADGYHRILVTNTGGVVPGFPEGARFLGTIMHPGGTVWHVFDGDAETTA